MLLSAWRLRDISAKLLVVIHELFHPVRVVHSYEMKAILEFNLPEEQAEYRLANEAGDWYSVVWEIDQRLRQHLKYGHTIKSADEALMEIRKLLYEELTDRGLDFQE